MTVYGDILLAAFAIAIMYYMCRNRHHSMLCVQQHLMCTGNTFSSTAGMLFDWNLLQDVETMGDG